MTWQIGWTARGLKDLRKLEPAAQKRILRAIERFAASGAGDLVKLTDVDPPEWRLRIGTYRVRLSKDPDRSLLTILRLLPRSKAY